VRFTDAGLPGAYLVEEERNLDERGWFARTFDIDEFRAAGLELTVAQSSVSWNVRRHTLRGLHLQLAPHEERKLVRCTRGTVFDVLVDLRVGEQTFGRWVAHRLDAASSRGLYVPPGVAHGFLTLEDDTELQYQISVPYEPSAASGVRWDDTDLAIAWPAEPQVISERDRSLPELRSLRLVE